MKRIIPTALMALLLASAATVLSAAEFRSINTISTPQAGSGASQAASADPGLETARKSLEKRTVDLARAGLTRLIEAWQTGGKLEVLLSDSFNDRDRFLDILRRVSPGDAKLRLLAIDAVRIVSRSFDPAGPDGKGWVLTSRVSIRARTQIEYTHPKGGYQKLDGINEFVLRVVQPLQPQR